MPIAKQMPWAGAIVAVLMPTTRPAPLTSGPPELPGFSGASVWITLSIIRPEGARSVRPSADTIPAVTVHWKPSGLPIATTICPTRSVADRPSSACGRPLPDRRSTAVSVAGSSPTRVASSAWPSVKEARSRAAPATTCALVST
jgi:hypothetical protein